MSGEWAGGLIWLGKQWWGYRGYGEVEEAPGAELGLAALCCRFSGLGGPVVVLRHVYFKVLAVREVDCNLGVGEEREDRGWAGDVVGVGAVVVAGAEILQVWDAVGIKAAAYVQ